MITGDIENNEVEFNSLEEVSLLRRSGFKFDRVKPYGWTSPIWGCVDSLNKIGRIADQQALRYDEIQIWIERDSGNDVLIWIFNDLGDYIPPSVMRRRKYALPK